MSAGRKHTTNKSIRQNAQVMKINGKYLFLSLRFDTKVSSFVTKKLFQKWNLRSVTGRSALGSTLLVDNSTLHSILKTCFLLLVQVPYFCFFQWLHST